MANIILEQKYSSFDINGTQLLAKCSDPVVSENQNLEGSCGPYSSSFSSFDILVIKMVIDLERVLSWALIIIHLSNYTNLLADGKWVELVWSYELCVE